MCVCECVCPSMRGGVAVGAHGGGAWMRTMPESGGVRWYFVEAHRYIGR